MTTSNTILAQEIEDVLFIPVECIHSQGDTVTYVIRKTGLGYSKQEIKTGISNSDETIVLEGLKEGDVLYLSDPPGSAGKNVELLSSN
jgi:hypothetical protein